MQITLNGQPQTVADDATVANLLTLFGLTPERVAVELNERLVRRATYADTRLKAGDRVEIVTLVGGG